jgi:hypothetical protein
METDGEALCGQKYKRIRLSSTGNASTRQDEHKYSGRL